MSAETEYLYGDLPGIPNSEIGIMEVPLLPVTAAVHAGLVRVVEDFQAAEVDITPWPTLGWRQLLPGTGVGGGTIEGSFESNLLEE